MTVGIAAKDYAFIKRFYECALKSVETSVCFCGLAADSDGLRQMHLHKNPQVLVCQSGQFPEAHSLGFPVVAYFTLTPLHALKLLEVKCSCESDETLLEVMHLCNAISQASNHFTEKSKPGLEFRCAVTEVIDRYGIAPASRGYQYILDALEFLYAEGIGIYKQGKIYGTLAKANNTTALRVERAMQHAIDSSTFKSCSIEEFLLHIIDAAGFVV